VVYLASVCFMVLLYSGDLRETPGGYVMDRSVVKVLPQPVFIRPLDEIHYRYALLTSKERPKMLTTHAYATDVGVAAGEEQKEEEKTTD